MNQPDAAERLLQRLAARRAAARAAILFERVWPAIWPALGVAGLFVVAALIDLPRQLPAWGHLLLLGGTLALVGTLLARGLSGIRRPDNDDADRRLEAASGLRHRPIAVLGDRPALDDPDGAALWRAHVARALAQIGRLRVGRLSPGLARIDRRALRGGLVVALVAALVIAGPDAPARLAQALSPTLPRGAAPPTTEVQAWVTPPAYTGLAPIFLRAETHTATVPAGGHLTVSVTGGSGTPDLVLDGQAAPFHALDAASFQADRDLTSGGRLVVRRDGATLAAWDVTVIADQPPTAAWTEPPGQAARSLQLRLPWQVSDDYGVVGLQAEIRLAPRPDAPPLLVTIPVPGGHTRDARGTSLQDLTAHPWAGLPVIARLVARDAPGQTGASADAQLLLPERGFQNPLARLLIAVRKQLSLRPDDRAGAVARLEPVLAAPDALAGDSGAYVALAATVFLIARNPAPDAVAEAQDRLWELALHLEEGAAERTARALEAARQAAREALETATADPSPQNRAELDRKLQELAEAIQQHMQALLDQARRGEDEMPFDQNAQRLDSREMQRLADAARDAAMAGRMDDARQQMAELERMLDALRNARVARGETEQRNAQRRQRGQQQMGALQDMIARQGQVLDHTQQRGEQGQDTAPGSAPGNNPGNNARGGAAPRPDGRAGTQPADPDAAREADRRIQQALRRALGELMQQFGDLTGEVPDSLSEADQAMRDAAGALGQGKDRDAAAAEQSAIAALQKGGQEMSREMARQFGPPQPGEAGAGDDQMGADGSAMGEGKGDGSGRRTRHGSADRGEGRDPLGRRYGEDGSGLDEGSDVAVPEERERQRTQAIQDELRRRGADRGRPQDELDYIDRLLRQF